MTQKPNRLAHTYLEPRTDNEKINEKLFLSFSTETADMNDTHKTELCGQHWRKTIETIQREREKTCARH